MKQHPVILILFALSVGGVAIGGILVRPEIAIAANVPKTDAPLPGIAVVELFTSEGCSSCPPADHVLAELVSEAATSGKPVYPLSFHVDYWNRLGWRDPFSDAAFSQRQHAYGQAMRLDSVYTPQMVVNGTSEFVGSDKRRAHGAISEALRQPARARVTLGKVSLNGGTRAEVPYKV